VYIYIYIKVCKLILTKTPLILTAVKLILKA